MVNEFWAVILVAGLIGWLSSCIMLMLTAFPRRDVFDSASGIKWGTATLVSFFIWIVAMLNA